MTKVISYGYVSVKDFEKMISLMKGVDRVYAVMFSLMRYRGLAVCDVCKLRLQDMNNDLSIRFCRKKTNVGGLMELPEIARRRLKEYIQKNIHRMRYGYLFPPSEKSNNNHLQENTLTKKFRQYCRLAGIKTNIIIDRNPALKNKNRPLHDIRLYDLRGSFLTDVVMQDDLSERALITASTLAFQKDTRATLTYVRKAVNMKQKQILNNLYKNVLSPEQKTLADFDTSQLSFQFGERKSKQAEITVAIPSVNTVATASS